MKLKERELVTGKRRGEGRKNTKEGKNGGLSVTLTHHNPTTPNGILEHTRIGGLNSRGNEGKRVGYWEGKKGKTKKKKTPENCCLISEVPLLVS